jgi:hypothetical protein
MGYPRARPLSEATVQKVLAATVSEAAFTTTVIEMAQSLGWMCVHFRPARTNAGWRTAGQGDVIGFPDVVMVRGDRIEAWELKSEHGRPTAEQLRWLHAWDEAGAATAIYRPSDLEEIKRVLSGGKR